MTQKNLTLQTVSRSEVPRILKHFTVQEHVVEAINELVNDNFPFEVTRFLFNGEVTVKPSSVHDTSSDVDIIVAVK